MRSRKCSRNLSGYMLWHTVFISETQVLAKARFCAEAGELRSGSAVPTTRMVLIKYPLREMLR
jgi:hypothetical protein